MVFCSADQMFPLFGIFRAFFSFFRHGKRTVLRNIIVPYIIISQHFSFDKRKFNIYYNLHLTFYKKCGKMYNIDSEVALYNVVQYFLEVNDGREEHHFNCR